MGGRWYGGGGVAVETVTLDSLCFGAEEGMWAVGAVGVLEERKACGRWCGGNIVVGGELGGVCG